MYRGSQDDVALTTLLQEARNLETLVIGANICTITLSSSAAGAEDGRLLDTLAIDRDKQDLRYVSEIRALSSCLKPVLRRITRLRIEYNGSDDDEAFAALLQETRSLWTVSIRAETDLPQDFRFELPSTVRQCHWQFTSLPLLLNVSRDTKYHPLLNSSSQRQSFRAC